MSEEQKSRNGGIATMWVAAGVLALGAVTGAALYAFYGGGGNMPAQQVAANTGSCAFDEAARATLDDAASGEVAAFRALDRAVSVSDLTFVDASGGQKSLADWKGKTVLVNLWATWCAPCRAEMPSLDALQRDKGGAQFEVVPISVDLGTDEKPKAFYEEIGLKDLGFYHDGALATLNRLKRDGLAFGLPATLLIDRDGCVKGTLNGPAEWHGPDALRLIETQLAVDSDGTG